MPRANASTDDPVAAPAPSRAAAPAGARSVAVKALGRGNVLVRDTGFRDDDWTAGFVRWSGAGSLPEERESVALDVENSVRAEEIAPLFGRIALIRIAFPSPADGRGFSLARHLRLLGYRGRLRACGHVLADQYAMARRSGFDEVEVEASIAARQPEEQWRYRANWRDNDYQARLRARPRRFHQSVFTLSNRIDDECDEW